MLTRNVVLAFCMLCATAHAARLSSHSTIHPVKDTSGNDSPPFCHGLECPEYEVTGTINDTEIRRYAPGTWVSTNISDISYDQALPIAFMRLFKYISGANEDNVKIEMTAPVKVKLLPSQGPFCENTFIMSFFVSPSFQGKPPAPTSGDLFIDHVPETSYFVTSYGGFTREREIVRRARELLESVQAAGYSFASDHFFSAGYDSPFRLIGRHNEVWVEQKASA